MSWKSDKVIPIYPNGTGIFEVNPKGELMWEYVIPEFAEYSEPLNEFITGEHNSCFKAHRYQEYDIRTLSRF